MSGTDPSPESGHRARVAVVGGGVSGLVAAMRMRARCGSDAVIDLYEAGNELGGVLHARTLAGLPVDVGAEAFVVRRPEVADLVGELGLSHHLVHPTSARPAVLARGGLHRLPRPALMGIPADAGAIAEVADAADVERTRSEPTRGLAWDPHTDISVGQLVGERFGRSVVTCSVDPMLGGVYSSLADDIGVRAAIPALAAALDSGAPSLTAAVASLVGAGSDGPVFGALDGGYRMLVAALESTGAAHILRDTPVAAVAPEPTGAVVVTESGVAASYDAVILAVPANVAARLVAATVPDLADALGRVPIAGSAVVAMAWPTEAALPANSGVLIGTDEDFTAKAFTFSTNKWAHLRDDVQVVRASFGRLGQPVEATDDELVATAVADLARVVELGEFESGVRTPSLPAAGPVDTLVQRWPSGLPSYGPGHLQLIAEIESHRPARLGLAGSTYAGVGVPACVGRAGRTARIVADEMRSGTMVS